VPHVALETLIDYARGLCSAANRADVLAHLLDCELCAGCAARLTRLAAIARVTPEAEPPVDVVNAAIALFHSLPSRTNVPPAMGRLVFDSANELPSDDASTARLLRFETPGDIELELLVTQRHAGVSVSGQVTARITGGPLTSSVSAYREPEHEVIASSKSSDEGEFRLDYDPPVDALLRFIIAGVLAPIHIFVIPEAV
jgi:hypothetical protein